MAQDAAERFAEASAAAIASDGSFRVALSGGSTPQALHRILAAEPYRSRIDWLNVHIFFGDERCVPPDDADSNYRMARETLLSKVPIPLDNVYRMAGEIDPTSAAQQYEQELKDQLGDQGLDLCFLGLGDDGHTASLFPHTPAVSEQTRWCMAQYVEHSTTGKSWRITLTAPLINRSKRVIFLVAGKKKSAALAEVLEGERAPETFPAQLVQPADGELIWLIDAAAAGMESAP
jgi:6-phosphogluconolactonase